MSIHALTNQAPGLRNRIKTSVKVTNIKTGAIVETIGVWDTGAQCSVIRHDLADKIGLEPVGMKTIIGVQSKEDRPYYYANVKLNNEQITMDINITDVDAFSSDADEGMLIGMDIIGQGDFSVFNFNGSTTMTFRVPSQKEIDYCEEVRLYNRYLKIYEARMKHGNELCPCGSGKKFMKCHGKIVE